MAIESQAFIRIFSEGVRMVNLPDFDLTGRKALVTGGGDGLGIEFTVTPCSPPVAAKNFVRPSNACLLA